MSDENVERICAANREKMFAAAEAKAISWVSDETHWACACVKRGRDGKLKAIKLHPRTTKDCRVCGSKQYPPTID
jgi:hypothetical protein